MSLVSVTHVVSLMSPVYVVSVVSQVSGGVPGVRYPCSVSGYIVSVVSQVSIVSLHGVRYTYCVSDDLDVCTSCNV